MTGKVTPDDLIEEVFTRTGADDPAVLQGPADGEDAAVIDAGEGTLVVSSDPISLSASHVGRLGVHVACNDVAVSGVDPRWLTVVIMLAGDSEEANDGDEQPLDAITADVDAAAREVGASIVGGHTEYLDALDRPLVSLTAMGVGEFVPTGGAQPGDRLVLAGAAAIEGTAILAADFGDEFGVDPDVCERAAGFLDAISVVPAARALREHATAMHDPTEGGILAGLQELARAAEVALDVDPDAVPVREETRVLADAAGVDPLRILGSGAVVAAVPERAVDDALTALDDAGIEGAGIGAVKAGEPTVALDGERLDEPVEDDLYALWESA